jgi:hypothetical protein
LMSISMPTSLNISKNQNHNQAKVRLTKMQILAQLKASLDKMWALALLKPNTVKAIT